MSALAKAVITWDGGGEASITSAQGVSVVVHSTRPYPPGAPAQGSLRVREPGLSITLKVANSRKVQEGVWEVRGKLQSATREVLSEFARLASASA